MRGGSPRSRHRPPRAVAGVQGGAACHANAPHAGATDWARIATLYERLLEVTANPLVKLNHAVAVGMATGPEDGLALVGRLGASGELRNYHLLYATRADFLRRLGRNSEAADAYCEALNLARTDAERRYLTKRMQEVSTAPVRVEAEGA